MRSTRIVVLRLMVEPDSCDGLRGALQLIPSDEWHSFQDDEFLLALLHRIIQGPHEADVMSPELEKPS